MADIRRHFEAVIEFERVTKRLGWLQNRSIMLPWREGNGPFVADKNIEAPTFLGPETRTTSVSSEFSFSLGDACIGMSEAWLSRQSSDGLPRPPSRARNDKQ